MSEPSKNINYGEINAGGAVIIGDNNEVKIQHILGNLQDYQNLEQEIEEAREVFNAIAPDKQEVRLKLSGTLEAKKEKLENIKKAIEQAFEHISKLTISTDRLDQAKALFLEGDIPGALEILKDEAIQADYLALQHAQKSEEERHSRRMDEITEKTKGIAEEWKMKAFLMATQYEDGDWFEKTKRYYQKVLEVDRDVDHIFAYAYFLQEHNQNLEALYLYEEVLKIYQSLTQSNTQDYLPLVAITLNNLANLHRDKKELDLAQKRHEESLSIYRSLVKSNSQNFLPNLAHSLNNLAALHYVKNELDQAQKEYEEALAIRKLLAQSDPQRFQPYVVMTLNNLGLLYYAKNEFQKAQKNFKEALVIYLPLVQGNSHTSLPLVAHILNNLANLHEAKNELEQAQAEYEEALGIYRIFAQTNPQAYLPNVAHNLNNLGTLHYSKNEVEKAQGKFEEALIIYRSLAQSNPLIFLQHVAMTLNNLANIHRDTKKLNQAQKELEEALDIRRSLAYGNPQTFLSDVATTLNNFANLHCDQNELEKAQGKFEEALDIYSSLAQSNPQIFLPKVAVTAINLAIFHNIYTPDRKRALELLKITLRAAIPFIKDLKIAQDAIERAKTMLEEWGLNVRAFLNELEEENK